MTTSRSGAALVAQVDGVPLPVPSAISRPYWDGCRRHELRFQRCTRCGAIPPLPTPRCPVCHTVSLSWDVSTGRGALYSWTVVWRPQHPAFTVPYAPAVVRLDEGHHVVSAMVGCWPDDLAPGRRVAVEFHRASEEITLPFFHLDASAG